MIRINAVKRKNLNTTYIENPNTVPMIRYHKLSKHPWLWDGFSTRIGGVSTNQYASMNLSFTLGDDREHVRKNFEIIGEAYGIPVNRMVYSHQTHTANVMPVTGEHAGMGILKERTYSDVDGIMTNEPGLCLVTSYADCVPLYFVDPVHRAIALSHSGWRGTVGNICKNTVELMHEKYGTCPDDLIACIGPSICVDCYEVSADVAEQFQKAYPKEQAEDIIHPKENGKYQLDLTMANYFNMVNAGILSDNIALPDLCTACNASWLHSHRASQGKRGGLCAFLMIK
ncbi:MAG: peptidoglycan editing factor PgeF [Lachnospiraceae bacterium]